MKYLAILSGGAIGALLRYIISGIMPNVVLGRFFPSGTLLVNMIGCFFIGLLFDLFLKFNINPNIKIFFLIGVLGSFTTFSTFAFESFQMLREKELLLGFLNIAFNNILGIILVAAGFITSRVLFKILIKL